MPGACADAFAFADEVLRLGRSSYRLGDNDDIYLGRIKMHSVKVLETYEARFGSAEALKGTHGDIASAIDTLPGRSPFKAGSHDRGP